MPNMCAAHSRHKAHGRRKAHEHRWSKARERGLGGPRQSDDTGRFCGPFGIREKRKPGESRKAHRATRRHAWNRTHRHAYRTRREPPSCQPKPRPKPLVEPPSPPIPLTPLVACSPGTPQDVLWHIAEYAPQLRKWLIANPSATPAMLEYLAQVGGPDVARSLQILLESLESRALDAIAYDG